MGQKQEGERGSSPLCSELGNLADLKERKLGTLFQLEKLGQPSSKKKSKHFMFFKKESKHCLILAPALSKTPAYGVSKVC